MKNVRHGGRKRADDENRISLVTKKQNEFKLQLMEMQNLLSKWYLDYIFRIKCSSILFTFFFSDFRTNSEPINQDPEKTTDKTHSGKEHRLGETEMFVENSFGGKNERRQKVVKIVMLDDIKSRKS